ncbi:MAG: outer membrane lipoprotein-sorting protein [Proteobacteria bacterium]|nr:outer membrane lipoprotein-sorting protein [Pseudomonadota bacterium]MBU1714938.1 outer membrane lipoprotein-sorting protein [Pseudomonadota bacterium]
MKKHLIILCFLIFGIVLSFFSGPSSAAEKDSVARARQILEEVDDLWRADSSRSIVTMQVKTANYTRSVRMENWSKGKDQSLVRIISPLKEKGTATLKSGNSVYTYLPKTDRTIRLTSSMMMGSWMGSHFTNDDLVKESRLSDDFDPDITFEGIREGRKVIEFTLVPKPDAPVVWGKIVTTVTDSDHLPINSLYFDEDMVLMRSIVFSRIEMMGGRLLPKVLRVLPADKEGEYTELIYEEISFGIDLPDSFFSLISLRRR